MTDGELSDGWTRMAYNARWLDGKLDVDVDQVKADDSDESDAGGGGEASAAVAVYGVGDGVYEVVKTRAENGSTSYSSRQKWTVDRSGWTPT